MLSIHQPKSCLPAEPKLSDPLTNTINIHTWVPGPILYQMPMYTSFRGSLTNFLAPVWNFWCYLGKEFLAPAPGRVCCLRDRVTILNIPVRLVVGLCDTAVLNCSITKFNGKHSEISWYIYYWYYVLNLPKLLRSQGRFYAISLKKLNLITNINDAKD